MKINNPIIKAKREIQNNMIEEKWIRLGLLSKDDIIKYKKGLNK